MTGAVLLSMMQIITLSVTGNPWGVTSALINWGAWVYEILGGNVSSWVYFKTAPANLTYEAGFLGDFVSFRNIGIILGAVISALIASQFKFKKIKSLKQIVAASLGGLLMGYGAGIASGCNIGAFYSGISSLSLSGWIFAVFLFLGSILGSKLLTRFLID
ncbi:MAG: YeeE/YedE family protein [Eubacteriaceae bacterium]|nr:YeeE/YedE family protein [Eubacteriaceae bacterium]